VEANHRDDMNF